MPSSYGRAIVAVVFVLALSFSPYAHADTTVTPIGDPYTDTLQLWSNIISAVEALAKDVATSLVSIQSHTANSNGERTQRQLPSATAQSAAAAAALVTQSGSNTATSSTNQNPFATSDQTTNSSNVKSAGFDPTDQSAAFPPTYNSAAFLPTSPTFDASAFVTQDELNAQLLLLSNALTAKLSAPATSPVPQYIAAGGNNENPFAAASAINNLSNVTITNANLTASEIPALNYLSLGGGFVSGLSTFSSGVLSLASSTIGNGTQAGGLTISGGATTTGNMQIDGANGLNIIGSGTNAQFLFGTTTPVVTSQGGNAPYQIVVDDLNAPGYPLAITATGGPVPLTAAGQSPAIFSNAFNNATGLYLRKLSTGAGDYFVAETSTGAPIFNVKSSGNVGIGTTTPYSRLEVWGPDNGASTTAFSVVNSASSTSFAVFDNGNSTYSGSIFQSSDQRLKTNITSLTASSSLSAIEALNPVSYFRLDQPGTGENLGFLAQQVGSIFPELVSTTSATALTPGGTLTLNYEGLIAPIVKAIQALSSELSTIENTIAGFAQSFTTHILTADTITANNQLCLTSGPTDPTPLCVTKAQLAALLSAAATPQTTESVSSSASADLTNSGNPDNANSSSDTPPVIQINGDNPAIVQAGETYNDLGATITGPQADLNLGIETYVNGTETSPVQIDTSAVATDTIDYVATDQNGLTSTSTRTVIIEAPSIVPTDDASSTATSTTQ